MPRTFVAIDLSDDVRDAFVSASVAFRDAAPDWVGEKWVAAENLHVTLLFLGEVSDAGLPAMTAALRESARGHAPFDLATADVVRVPRGGRSRMLWGRLADPGGCAATLAADVRGSLAPWTADADTKPFRPHVTLVRARRPRTAPDSAIASANAQVRRCAGTMSVASVTLFASTLTRTGPIYEVLSSAPLGVS